MALEINLPAEIRSKLDEHAAVVGVDSKTLARQAIEEMLSRGHSIQRDSSAAVDDEGLLQGEDWVKQFREWAHSHKPRSPNVDDSRESIYEGCGE